MRTKLLFPTSLLLLSLLFVYVTPTYAKTFGPDISYTCLGNGEFNITVTTPARPGYVQFPTFCVIRVIPEQSEESAFSYHMNLLPARNISTNSAGNLVATVVPAGDELVFSRVLNLGVYTQWCMFKLQYVESSVFGFGVGTEINIDQCMQPCNSDKKKITPDAIQFTGPSREVKQLQATRIQMELIVKEQIQQVEIEAAANPAQTGISIKEFEEYLAKMAKEEEAEVNIFSELEHVNSVSLLLYPNPSSGSVSFQLEGTTDKLFHLQILDITGKLVSDIENVNSSYLIEKNFLKPGVYKVLLNGDAGGFYHSTLVMQ